MVKYTGKKLEAPIPLLEIEQENTDLLEKKQEAKTLEPYFPDPHLVEAVNLAIVLQRPLLVMGEPGCGKSALAEAVAYELFNEPSVHDPNIHEPSVIIDGNKQDYRQWLFKWHIKSTTKAKDGFYDYDALRRLLDVQLAQGVGELAEQAKDPMNYITLRPMAEAIKKSSLYSTHPQKSRAILLIDEIDKADLDFPNDLLNELEGGEFIVPETGKPAFETAEGQRRTRPIIIITSNREKELPDAFLRRCIYYFIPPFGEARLKQILESRFYPKDAAVPLKGKHLNLRDNAVEAFLDTRIRIKAARSGGKNVSTSELIDWFGALKSMSEVEGNDKATNAQIGQKLAEIKAFLEEKSKNLPLPLQQALFKNYETVDLFKK